jgi:hypothetical protein
VFAAISKRAAENGVYSGLPSESVRVPGPSRDFDDPNQKAAMLQYAEWSNRLAEYRESLAIDGADD